jgi:hypothetical protein
VVAKISDRPIDPEGICTRVAARLIEQLGCLDIAPDSPVWEDLTKADGQRIGELRIYRGRGVIEKVVGSHFAIDTPAIESHSLIVFTRPESPIPHFVLDAVRFGPQASFHVDLLPKRDLAISLSYVDGCYSPLSVIRAEIDRNERFKLGNAPLRQRAFLSPWMALYTHDPAHTTEALGYVERYFAHWAQLLRTKTAELDPDPSLIERDRSHRRLVFSRDVDPVWGTLDRAVGPRTVDRLLAVLTD